MDTCGYFSGFRGYARDTGRGDRWRVGDRGGDGMGNGDRRGGDGATLVGRVEMGGLVRDGMGWPVVGEYGARWNGTRRAAGLIGTKKSPPG